MPISRTGTCSKDKVSSSKFKVQNYPPNPPLSKLVQRGGENGFTLFELIVVIFILSIVVGLVMPSFYGLVEGGLKSDAGKMASILRRLNDDAVARKETIPLKINLDSRTLMWTASEGERKERLESLFSVNTTSTGNVTEGEVTLFFGPLGLQDSTVVTLKKNNEEMFVSFNPLSGRVKVIQNSK